MNITHARLAKFLIQKIWLLSMLVLFSINVLSEELPEASLVEKTESKSTDAVENGVLDQQVSLSVEELKKQVIKLNRDLFILEEDLLFPANTQLVVYLSFATGEFLNLDSVSLKVDDEVVAAHLYTERQLEALKRGGMQRLFMGNLKTGEHEITAVLHGIGPDKKDYKLAASKIIEKDTELTSLEIRIEDQSENYQPRVSVVEWEE
tara:strand:- start:289 stop:906 length:618 start_codon:yes stop_codon:yes gene_type:complete